MTARISRRWTAVFVLLGSALVSTHEPPLRLGSVARAEAVRADASRLETRFNPAAAGLSEQPGQSTTEWFTERAQAVGLDFVHFNGMSGEYYFEEVMGSGVALLDYDNDGDLDIYIVQGQMLGQRKTLADALMPPKMPLPLTDRLYRNDLEIHADGSRTIRFTDVTKGSGLGVRTYGMGVATGDFDNDGWIDVYRTRRGAAQLFHNNGDGTFTDVSAR